MRAHSAPAAAVVSRAQINSTEELAPGELGGAGAGGGVTGPTAPLLGLGGLGWAVTPPILSHPQASPP